MLLDIGGGCPVLFLTKCIDLFVDGWTGETGSTGTDCTGYISACHLMHCLTDQAALEFTHDCTGYQLWYHSRECTGARTGAENCTQLAVLVNSHFIRSLLLQSCASMLASCQTSYSFITFICLADPQPLTLHFISDHLPCPTLINSPDMEMSPKKVKKNVIPPQKSPSFYLLHPDKATTYGFHQLEIDLLSSSSTDLLRSCFSSHNPRAKICHGKPFINNNNNTNTTDAMTTATTTVNNNNTVRMNPAGQRDRG